MSLFFDTTKGSGMSGKVRLEGHPCGLDHYCVNRCTIFRSEIPPRLSWDDELIKESCIWGGGGRHCLSCFWARSGVH